MGSKSSFGNPGVRFLRFWMDLIEVRFGMIFGAAQKMKKIRKRRWRYEQSDSAATVGGTPGACRRAFGVCKVKQSHAEFTMNPRRPVPCEQGAADIRPAPLPPTSEFVLIC